MAFERITPRFVPLRAPAALLGLLVLTTACAEAPPPRPAATPTPLSAMPLGPGDRIRVAVYGQGDLGDEQDVDHAGDISLPLVGRLTVTGQTPGSLEDTIRDRLNAQHLVVDPKVLVAVVHYRPVYVVGEVTKPGAFPYTSDLTVLSAVALANGYTYRARTARITVIHGGGAPVPADETTPLLPGDIVQVPERWF